MTETAYGKSWGRSLAGRLLLARTFTATGVLVCVLSLSLSLYIYTYIYIYIYIHTYIHTYIYIYIIYIAEKDLSGGYSLCTKWLFYVSSAMCDVPSAVSMYHVRGKCRRGIRNRCFFQVGPTRNMEAVFLAYGWNTGSLFCVGPTWKKHRFLIPRRHFPRTWYIETALGTSHMRNRKGSRVCVCVCAAGCCVHRDTRPPVRISALCNYICVYIHIYVHTHTHTKTHTHTHIYWPAGCCVQGYIYTANRCAYQQTQYAHTGSWVAGSRRTSGRLNRLHTCGLPRNLHNCASWSK